MEDDVLYLFSSNTRPRYLKDVLNVLGYPTGFTIHFRYERRYVQDKLWQEVCADASRLEGRPANIVFVDQDMPAPQGGPPLVRRLSPVRRAHVRRIESFEETLHVHFTLGEFFAYVGLQDPDYDRELREVLGGDVPSDKYVALGRVLRHSVDVSEVGDAWKSVVDQIANVDRFRDETLFVLIRGVKAADGSKERLTDLPDVKPRPEAPGGRTWVELRPGRHYVIDLAFRLAMDPGAAAAAEHRIALTADSALIAFPQTEQTALDARYDFRSFDAFVKMTERDAYTAVVVSLGRFGGEPVLVKAPDIILPVVIRLHHVKHLLKILAETTGIVAAAVGAALTTSAIRDGDYGFAFAVGILLIAVGGLVATVLRGFFRG